jgi:hypothetical protein
MFYSLGKISYGFVRVAVLNALADTMVQMSLQNNLPDLVQRALDRIYLNKHILARYVLVYHFFDRRQLTLDFVYPSV